MRICFLCGCDWVCGHREPELVAWEARNAERIAATTKPKEPPAIPDSRKPITIAPSASYGQKRRA